MKKERDILGNGREEGKGMEKRKGREENSHELKWKKSLLMGGDWKGGYS
jgi:hypothetical protein